LTTLRPDASPHVVPVGFAFDPEEGLARMITSGDSTKARNAGRAGAVAALCQVDGARWITLSGPIRVGTDPEVIADAVARYTRRYRPPRVNPKRVALIMEVSSVLGSLRFGGGSDAV
jgi:PPOX class probable F420-dependent enzyme